MNKVGLSPIDEVRQRVIPNRTLIVGPPDSNLEGLKGVLIEPPL